MSRLQALTIAAAALVGAAILPAYVAPCAVILTSPASHAGAIADSAFLAYFGTLDTWAHESRYGFSVAPGYHLEPRDSLAMLRAMPAR